MGNVTIKDVAKTLNVSESTVSLALNNYPAVSKKTKERVVKCARDMGYVPNPIARGLATKRTMTIGCICPDPENPSYARLIKKFSSDCEEYGYSVVLAVSENDPEREGKALNHFFNAYVDGIVLMPMDIGINDHPSFERLKNQEVPFVFAMTYYKGFENDVIMPDYTNGSYMATKSLIEKGCKNIWYFVAEDTSIPVAKLRLDGWKKAFKEAGIEWKQDWIVPCERMDSKYCYDMAKKCLEERSVPDAICTQNDYMAMGVRKAIIDCGFRIPDDIALVGYDDVLGNFYMDHPLTTVRLDIDKIARESLKMLINKIENRDIVNDPVATTIPTEFIKRSTTL